MNSLKTPMRWYRWCTFRKPNYIRNFAVLVILAPMSAISQGLPTPWASSDIGSTGAVGSASYVNGTFNVAGSGSYIFFDVDSFRFVYQAVTGDATIVARVASTSNVSGTTKCGVMFRDNLGPAASNVFLTLHANWGVSVRELQYRSAAVPNSAVESWGPSTTAPTWLKLVRQGGTFTGYTSSDGVNWGVPYSTVSVPMATTVYVGLAVSAESYGALATASFNGVSVTTSGSSQALPSPWISSDIGAVGPQGSASDTNGTFSVAGSGSYIYFSSDSFRYVYRSVILDQVITARISSVQNVSSTTKAGIMFRDGLGASANNVFFALHANAGSPVYEVQYRSPSFPNSNIAAYGPSGSAPTWLRLERVGNTFTAYTSFDGVAWGAPYASVTVAMNPGALYVGLAVSSENSSVLANATFDNVSISTIYQPQQITCSDPTTFQIGTAEIRRTSGGVIEGRTRTWMVGNYASYWRPQINRADWKRDGGLLAQEVQPAVGVAGQTEVGAPARGWSTSLGATGPGVYQMVAWFNAFNVKSGCSYWQGEWTWQYSESVSRPSRPDYFPGSYPMRFLGHNIAASGQYRATTTLAPGSVPMVQTWSATAPSPAPISWQVGTGSDRAQLSCLACINPTVTALNSSSGCNQYDVVIYNNYGGFLSEPFFIFINRPWNTVFEPRPGIPAWVTNEPEGDGYLTKIHYQVKGMCAADPPMALYETNETFGQLTDDWGGSNWGTGNAEGNYITGDTWADRISMHSQGCLSQPCIPQLPLSLEAHLPVHSIPQSFYVGSQSPGSGARVQSQTFRRYTDMGAHENIVTPNP